jgi:hypothetical protein
MLAEQNVVHCPFHQKAELQWTGEPIELVELVRALHEAGCFGATSPQTQFSAIGKMFGCNLKNHYRLWWDIKNRVKGDRAKFLDKLKKVFTEMMKKSDE